MIMAEQKSRRGFAGMSAEKRRQIASRGGQAAQAKGAHRWTPEEAARLASLGGKMRHAKPKSGLQDRALTAGDGSVGSIASDQRTATSPVGTATGSPGVRTMHQLAAALGRVQMIGAADYAAGLQELQRASEEWAVFSLRTFQADDLTAALKISSAISEFITTCVDVAVEEPTLATADDQAQKPGGTP